MGRAVKSGISLAFLLIVNGMGPFVAMKTSAAANYVVAMT
jgi:hypothetical protein